MELGASFRLFAGPGIVGVSWTSTPTASEADLLITTTATQIQVHAADDRRVLSSWLTRPGATNRFTVPTVQHRLWRTLFAVQDGCKLFAWHEREPSLERAVRARLRGEVFALRVSKHIPALVVVYVDGSVGVHNERLEEVFMVPAAGDSGRATWARLTSLPGAAAGRCVLMVLTQQQQQQRGGGGEGSGGRKRPTPAPAPATEAAPGAKLLVFALSVSGGSAAPVPPPPPPPPPPSPLPASPGSLVPVPTGAPTPAPPAPAYALSLRHMATQALAPPAGAPPDATVAAVTLHKFLAQLGVVWSSGHWVTLQFPRGALWYAAPPREALARHLRAVVPGGSAGGARGELRAAAFALDPSCVVFAGANGKGGVGMSVWDVRYGVKLGSTEDVGGGEEEAEEAGGARAAAPAAAAAAAAGGKRRRGAPPAAPEEAGTPTAPLPLLHVTVSEGGSWVVVASPTRVSITPVALRGASLSSALGRMAHTLPLLTGGGGECSAKHFSLEDCVRAAAGAVVAGGARWDGGTLPPAAVAAWHTAAARPAAGAGEGGAGGLTADCAAIENATKYPTAASLKPLLERHGYLWGEGDGALGEGAARAGGGRRRGSGAAPPAAGAATAAPPPQLLAPPPPVFAALMRRCLSELRAAAVAAPAPAAGAAAAHLGFLAPLAPALAARGLLAAPYGAPILSALLALASSRAPHPAAPHAARALLAAGALLRGAGDLPEAALVAAFSALLLTVPAATLGAGWRAVRGSDGSDDGADAALSGLLHFSGLVFSAPRNDVFMEAALRALPLAQVKVLLALLLRLLRLHGEHTLPLPLALVRGEGAPAPPPAPLFPSLGTALDWLRLVLDAHFSTLLLQCRAQAARRGAPAAAADDLLGLLEGAAAALRAAEGYAGEAADLKGQLEHILNRLPLPQPPEPEYSVELLQF
jgi:hypothetical protein